MKVLYFLGVYTYFDFAIIHRMSVHKDDTADFAVAMESRWWPRSAQNRSFSPDTLGICDKKFIYNPHAGMDATSLRECATRVHEHYTGVFADAGVRPEEYDRIYILPGHYNSIGAYLILQGLPYYCLESGIHYFENIQDTVDAISNAAYSDFLTVLGASDSSSKLATRVITPQSTIDQKDAAYETWDYVSAVINLPCPERKRICKLFGMTGKFPAVDSNSLLYTAQNPPVTEKDSDWMEEAKSYYQFIISKFSDTSKQLILLMPEDSLLSEDNFREVFPSAVILPCHYREDLLLYVEGIGNGISEYITVAKYSHFWTEYKKCIWLTLNIFNHWKTIASFFDLRCQEFFETYAPNCSRFFVYGFGIEWSDVLKRALNPRKIVWEWLPSVDAYWKMPMAQPYAPLVALIDAVYLQHPEQLSYISDLIKNAHAMSEFYFINTLDTAWSMPDSLYQVCGKEAVGFIPQFNMVLVCRDADILAERISLKEFTDDMMPAWFAKFPKATGDLRLHQMIELFCLIEFSECCRKANVAWFLDYGNLLGAVRNGGFLPWDDELDTTIMCDEVYKLHEYLTSGVSTENETYKLILFFPRRSNTSISVFKFVGIIPEETIYKLDIFITCWIAEPECSLELLKIQDKYIQQKRQLFSTNNEDSLSYNLDENVFTYFNGYTDEIKKLNMGRTGDFIASISFKNWRSIYPYEAQFPLKTTTFEGYEFPAPNDIATVLNSRYGDYIKLPHFVYCHKNSFDHKKLIEYALRINEHSPEFFDKHIRNLVEEWPSP